MSQKPKFSKEEMVNAAFEIACESGIDNVMIKTMQNKLNCSASPIFTIFNSIDDLRQQVLEKAANYWFEYMKDIFEFEMPFKVFGLRWVKFAIDYPNLYKSLFLTKYSKNLKAQQNSILKPLLPSLQKAFELNEFQASELLKQMRYHSLGIASVSLGMEDYISIEEVSKSLSESCIGIVMFFHMQNGNLDKFVSKFSKYDPSSMPNKI